MRELVQQSASSSTELSAAAEQMLVTVGKNCPKAKLDGFLVQEMIKRPRAYELICGVAVDNTFGPYLLFGQGGVSVEVVADSSLALAPINYAMDKGRLANAILTEAYVSFLGLGVQPPTPSWGGMLSTARERAERLGEREG